MFAVIYYYYYYILVDIFRQQTHNDMGMYVACGSGRSGGIWNLVSAVAVRGVMLTTGGLGDRWGCAAQRAGGIERGLDGIRTKVVFCFGPMISSCGFGEVTW